MMTQMDQIEENGIGDRVKAVRLHFDLTKKRLGEIAGITGQGIEDIESGDSKSPRINVLLNICRELQVNLNWLAEGKGSMLEKSAKIPSDYFTIKEENTALRTTVRTLSELLGKPHDLQKTAGMGHFYLPLNIPFADRHLCTT